MHDTDFERRYQGIELVSGMGSPRRKKLCVMSFAAFLAGERHTDDPRCASSLIRQFAIVINDGMDKTTRQRLKPFAPKVVGTNDGRDEERADLLFAAIFDDVAPRHFGERHRDLIAMMRAADPSRPAHIRMLIEGVPADDMSAIEGLWRIAKAYRRNLHNSMAEAAGSLLVNLAQLSISPAETAWYWNKAIDLLDRMCAVGSHSGEGAGDGQLSPIPSTAEERAHEKRSSGNIDGRPGRSGVPALAEGALS